MVRKRSIARKHRRLQSAQPRCVAHEHRIANAPQPCTAACLVVSPLPETSANLLLPDSPETSANLLCLTDASEASGIIMTLWLASGNGTRKDHNCCSGS
jgi:hypothetical protein